MATDYRAMTYAEVVPGTNVTSGRVRWARALPLMLLVPIVFVFGTPVFAFALLAAVLGAPVIVAAVAVMAAQHEHEG